ncbi:MAG: DUF4349 domain-containing protein, partial [Eubacteriales bacterium]
YNAKSSDSVMQSYIGEENFGAYYDMDYSTEESPASAGTSVSTGVSAENDLSSRKIIKNARISFQTQIYDEFLNALSNCIASYGGYIESAESYGNTLYSQHSSRNSYITARIPAQNYDAFMSDASDMGTLTYRSESSNDVTMSYVDTESHIKALETEYEALITLLDKAQSLDDVIQLQSRLTEVNYQLDSYKSQLRTYDDLISYCTINIDVNEVYREIQPESTMTFGERIMNGLEETFIDIGDDISELTVWFITSLPYIVIWAAVIVLAVFIIKSVVKRVKHKNEEKRINSIINQINENSENNKDNN